VGETREYGLWGFRDFDGRALTISVNTASGLECADYAQSTPTRIVGDIQFFNLTGLRSGAGRIDAITAFGHTWDYFQLAVSNVMSIGDQLRDAVASGRILFQNNEHRRLFFSALDGDSVNGHVAQLAPELQTVLAVLARRSLTIMRTYTPADGARSPHAELHGNTQIVRAVDIMEYAGGRLHWTVERETLIVNVTRLLSDLPATVRYNIGFVRPVGGPTGSDEAHDVFFHVPPERAAVAFNPDGSWGWGAMIEPPKSRVRLALAGKTCDYVFPDGADHIHLKAF
jgi:hypothetical protein